MTDEQRGRLSCSELTRYGNWLVKVPHGPYDAAGHRAFVDSLPAEAELHDVVEGSISGGSGVGHPGYYDERLIAVFQPDQPRS